MLQKHNCVAFLQHWLSYNGSIDAPTTRRTRYDQETSVPTIAGPSTLVPAEEGRGGTRWAGEPCARAGCLREQLTERVADVDDHGCFLGDERGGWVECGQRPGDPPGVEGGKRFRAKETSGTYSEGFAECMRAHGVSNLPDPNGSAVPSGVDPASPAYQAALNGPCKSLAPPGWVSSGPVTRP